MIDCIQCVKKKKCITLCAEAEAYVNQDNRDDTAWIKIKPKAYIDQMKGVKMEGVTTTEAILQNYFVDRMDPKDIAKKYYKSTQYVYWLIKKYKAIIADNIKKSISKC